MKIAYGNTHYHSADTRGRNAHIHQFITQAVRQGHEIWVWPAREHHPQARLLPAGRLARVLALRRMDALYVRLQNDPVDLLRYGLAPHRQLIGSPLMVWEFNALPDFNPVVGQAAAAGSELARAFRRYAAGCDLAICVSEKLAEAVQDRLGIRRTLVVPNGSDPDLFRPADPAEIEARGPALQVVWMGSGDLVWHNFDLMLGAARCLWEQGAGQQVHFHILGKTQIDPHELPPNVSAHGPQPYAELPGWLAKMDVGLVLSHPGPYDFNSPLKFFDYLSSGLAVVATPQPQVAEVLRGLDASDLIVPPDQPEALAALLLRLAADRPRLRQLGAQGRQALIERFQWARAVTDTMNAISDLRRKTYDPSEALSKL